jgi:hypothetical protein
VEKSTARQVVLISMLVSGGVITYDLISHKEQLGAGQAFKAVWSMGLLFLLLAMMSDTVPDLAAPFAGVTTLGIVIGRQGALGKIVKIGSTAAPAPAASQQHQQNLTNLPTNQNPAPQKPGTNP